MGDLRDITAAHGRYQDAMVSAFETHLRQIVATAQGRVIADLSRRLTMTDGIIDATPANYRIMRKLSDLFMAEMERAGYPQLVQAFVGEFGGTVQFLDETLRFLSSGLKTPLPLESLNRNDAVLATFKLTAADALEDVVRGVAGATMQRAMMSVGGLQFGSLVEMLVDRFETTIAKARTIAETSMSTFYRTATDRAFRIIEKEMPSQRYFYAGPVDKLERPFCRHLTDAAKSYTREQIARMDNGQIPNVFISGGGWNCRHSWLLDVSDLEVRAVEAA